jgi:hypothetical protein
MMVLSVEVLSKEAAASPCLQARRDRRETRKRNARMTSDDLKHLLRQDISSFMVRSDLLQDRAPVESQLPQVAKYEVDKYEEPEAIAILRLLRTSGGRPVLVEFDFRPSKAFEERLRHSAMVRNLRVHIAHLTGAG